MLGKLFTRVLNNRLTEWAETYRVYIEGQFAFRKLRGTVDAIFVLHSLVEFMLRNNRTLYTFFIDFSKAFDYVVRENLWYKLLKIGVNGKIINIIRSMYSCVKTRVQIHGEKSQYFQCNLGVRQGECLSPFLFAVYLNDLEDTLSHTGAGIKVQDVKMCLLLYADDAVIFSDTPVGLQDEIDTLRHYCNRWKLRLNLEKSRIVVFRKGNRVPNIQWYYGDTEIKVCSKIRYLGLVITSNGLFTQTQQVLSEQANKAIFALYKRLNDFKYLNFDEILDLFDKYISPILNYGCEIWGFHPGLNVERIHLSFCKQLLKVKRSTQNDFVYGILGRFPMVIIRYMRIIKYWINIVTAKKHLYINNLYSVSLTEIDNPRRSCWARSVRDLLCSCGFAEAWINQGVGDTQAFLSQVKNRLLDMYRQNWSSQIDESSRSSFFKLINPQHNYNSILNIRMTKSHKLALIRLILSSHHLKIETGRWTRPPTERHRRYCDNCPEKIEDEFHFIFECSLYTEIRNRFIPNYYRRNPSMFKLIRLFNEERSKTIRLLAKFIFTAFQLHATLHR
jgi:hypothetical protein